MPWCSPLTRREISLVLFSITIFVLFYNLETSFSSDGLNPTSGSTDKEDWDNVIYGNWSWEEDRVAENARKQAIKEKNRNTTVPVSFHAQTFGLVGVNDGILEWDGQIPTTTVLKHVPGYTVMDNVFMLNGTLFVVTNDPAFPPLASIASSAEDPHAAPRPSDWQVLSATQARETLGSFGCFAIHGVSWLVTDASPSNYTFLSLWRTYSSLDPSLSPDTLTLPPPRRIFYPNVPTFMGERPDPNGPIILRQRSSSGFHPFLAKAAFPTLGLLYQEDWADYALPHAPYLLKRVVVADQSAARRAYKDVPPFAVPLLELKASKDWWEPIRREVSRFLGVPEDAPKARWLAKGQAVVTYVSRQDAVGGPKLRAEDHAALVEALGELGKGYEVHVVSSEVDWVARMSAIAQSTIVLGVYGVHMADSVFMPPSSRATVMEMFPPRVFVRDVQLSVEALKMGYVAWVEGRQHAVGAFPPVAPPREGDKDEVPINVPAMIRAIKRLT